MTAEVKFNVVTLFLSLYHSAMNRFVGFKNIFLLRRWPPLFGRTLILLLILQWVGSVQMMGQTQMPTVVLPEERPDFINLSNYVEVYPVEEFTQSVEEVIQLPDSLFLRRSDYTFDRGYTKAWIRFAIVNTSGQTVSDFASASRGMDTVVVYELIGGKPFHLETTGIHIHSRNKSIPHSHNLFHININPGDTIQYYTKASLLRHFDDDEFFSFNIRKDLIGFLHHFFYENLFWGFLAGIMILFSVFSLVMFLSFKERIFIYYSALMLTFTLYFLSIHDMIERYSNLPPEFKFIYLQGIIISFLIVFNYLFISKYLNLRENMPRFFKFYSVFTLPVVLITTLHYFIFNLQSIGYDVANFASLSFLIISMIPIFYLSYKKNKEARVLLLSSLLLFLGALTFILTLLRVLPPNVLSINSFQLGAIGFSGTLFYGLFNKINSIQKERIKFRLEKEKTDELLFNVLPAEVARELKEKGICEARDYSNVSVLFTDFKDFTATSAALSAKELVNEVNTCYIAFDKIIEKYGVEKIKTIGDSYMAAGGLHPDDMSETKNTVLAAIEMQDFLLSRKEERSPGNLHAFDMRVGIHTGPVIAGIVGVKKFQYDIWGDTVNTASKIESNGEIGKVNISETTYQFIKEDPDFFFKERPPLTVKGKSEINMWFVQKSKSRVDREKKHESEVY